MRLLRPITLVLLLALAICPLLADGPDRPPLDVILLVQDSRHTYLPLLGTGFRALRRDDRIALITFAKRPRLRVPLTEDHQKVATVVRGIVLHSFNSSLRRKPQSHLWDALEDVCGRFPSKDGTRRRAVIVLFADQDNSSQATFESAGRALVQSQVTLSAAVVVKREPVSWLEHQVQTPPIIGPASVPVIEKWGMIPEATLTGITKLAAQTQGLVLRDEWNLTKLIDRIRAR